MPPPPPKPSSETSTWRADPPRPVAMPQPPLVHPPYTAITVRGSDFVVHHVCRRCNRPRSLQFHRDNPVLPSMPPPPAGICGRCKRAEQEGTATAAKGKAPANAVPREKVTHYAIVEELPHGRSRPEHPIDTFYNRVISDRISIHLHQNAYGGQPPSATHAATHTNHVYHQPASNVQTSAAYTNGAQASPSPPQAVKASTQPPRTEHKNSSAPVVQTIPQPSEHHSQTVKSHGHDDRLPTNKSIGPSFIPPPPQVQPRPRSATVQETPRPQPPSKVDEAAAMGKSKRHSTTSKRPSTTARRDFLEAVQDHVAALDEVSLYKTKDWVDEQRTASAAMSLEKPASEPPMPATKAVESPAAKDWTEGSVRRIAREEVARYRYSERKIEGHPQPYVYTRSGHGVEGQPAVKEGVSTTARSAGGNVDAVMSHASKKGGSNAAKDVHTSVRSQASSKRPAQEQVVKPPASVESETHSRKSANNAHSSVRQYDAKAVDRHSNSKPDVGRPLTVETQPSQTHSKSIERGVQKVEDAFQARSALDNADIHVGFRVEESTSSKNTLHHRRSFDTDLTVHPHSSISQRSPVEYEESRIARRPAEYIDRILDDARKMPAHNIKADWPVTSHRVVSSPPRRPPSPSQPREFLTRSAYLSRAEGDRERVRKDRDYEYQDGPPRPPSPPPEPRRLSDQEWTYEERISPSRVRVVRERVIRSMSAASLERQMAPSTMDKKPATRVTRYEIIDAPSRATTPRYIPPSIDMARLKTEPPRIIPEDRGRARLREGEEQPKQRLRSILRSSSNSDRRTRSTSFTRRVSFSEAVDVALLSPPPSSSQLDRITDDGEKYHYQRLRRPAPTEIELANKVPDEEALSRRRALARALSESPSRERGLGLLDRRPSGKLRKAGRPRENWASPSAAVRAPMGVCSDGTRMPVAMVSALPPLPVVDEGEYYLRKRDVRPVEMAYRPRGEGNDRNDRDTGRNERNGKSRNDRHDDRDGRKTPKKDRDTHRYERHDLYDRKERHDLIDRKERKGRDSRGERKTRADDGKDKGYGSSSSSGSDKREKRILREGTDEKGHWVEYEYVKRGPEERRRKREEGRGYGRGYRW